MMPPLKVFGSEPDQKAAIANSQSRPELWIDNTSSQVCQVNRLQHGRVSVRYPTGTVISLSGLVFRETYSPAEIPVGS